MTGEPLQPTAISSRAGIKGTIVVWCLVDGRPGHRRQIEGLVAQLERRRRTLVCSIDVAPLHRRQTLSDLVHRKFPAGDGLPDPHLIVVAGHSTHLPSLTARRARGGRVVVLMRPTLPTALFDLCLVPEHDLLSLSGRLNRLHVVPTRGVLNPFEPAADADAATGLILIGGPSKHHGWSDEGLFEQLRQLQRLSPTNVTWTLTTSRRTPHEFARRLQSELHAPSGNPAVNVIPFDATGPGWLADTLSRSRTVFVSEDSVSMIYEALTVGADVGLLQVPRRRRGRNAACIDRLLAERYVVSFDDWCADRFENRRRERFNEAVRCADIVCDQLLGAA
jgi:uncharacterized protein